VGKLSWLSSVFLQLEIIPLKMNPLNWDLKPVNWDLKCGCCPSLALMVGFDFTPQKITP